MFAGRPSRLVGVAVRRFRRGGRGASAWALRLTAAAVASYLVAVLLFPGTQPLLAPLTALLVVQLTPVSLMASGIERVFSVVAGVLVAIAISAAVHLTWWSLGIVIGVSLLVGQALRLGSNLLEVPISAMLVLGVGSTGAEAAGGQRIAETLVGAGVGVLSNLVFPPKVPTVDAGAALHGLADDLATLLDDAASEMAEIREPEKAAELARSWLDDARRLTHSIPVVGSALLRAEQGRRLNLRALGTPDAGPGLRQGMEALEHSAVAVRSLFRSIADAAEVVGDRATTGEVASGSSDGPIARDVAREGSLEGDVRHELVKADALVLSSLAAGLRAFGELVRAEAEPGQHNGQVVHVVEALEGLREAQARITDLLLADAGVSRTELNFALMSAVKRIISELDLDQRIMRQGRRPR